LFTKVLIVGFGSIGKKHLQVINESIPHADILVLKRTNKISPEYKKLRFTSVISEALDFEPQIAVISNPAPFHLAIASKLAKIGCHLLIEKPISDSLKDKVSFLDLLAKNPIKCQIGYNLRYLPSLIKLKQLLDQKIIGNLYSIRCETGQYLPNWRKGVDYRDGVSARRSLGGGVLNELSHEIDYLHWLLGEISWVSCWSDKVSLLEVDVEDVACILMGIKSLYCPAELPVSLNLDFLRHDQTRQCTLIGAEGTLRWNAIDGTIQLYKSNSGEWTEIFESSDKIQNSYLLQWEDFLSNIKLNRQPNVDASTGFHIVKILEALKQSSAEGKKLHIL
jgi:predicted dehydrogenase